MSDTFSSKALEVNLARTRDTEIEIPEEQQWFLDLSQAKWGIHNRTSEFITELNHKYVNYQFVIDALHTISLTDLWFYNSLEESEKAFTALVNIFSKLLHSDMDENEREILVKTLIRFVDRLANLDGFPEPVVGQCLSLIREDMVNKETIYMVNSGYFKSYFNRIAQFPEYRSILFEMTFGLMEKCITYWENTSQVEEWLKGKSLLFHSLDQEKMRQIGTPFFEELRQALEKAENWDDLCELMFFNDISNYFRSFTETFDTSLEKIYYLYFLLHLPGMADLNDHLLYDMNRQLRNVLKELNEDDITVFLDTIMVLFDELKVEHGGTVLDCILTLGKEVINTGSQPTISYFVKGLIKLGFNYPGNLGVSKDWQIQVNTNHVKNIRVWLELIEYSPYAMRELLEALIVNLKLGGIFISDTDLFQRDVTKLLNSDIGPVYREMKQLARIFPVYFREIGAEGKLREVTTAMDELSMRKDRLIHFMRKQTHTESNNTHIELSRRIILYWYNGDRDQLKKIIPDDVFDWLTTKNEWYVHAHEILVELCRNLDATPDDLLLLDVEKIEAAIQEIPGGKKRDKLRVSYLFQVYSLLREKYSFESEDILTMMKSYRFFTGEELDSLKAELAKNSPEASLCQIYRLMNHLKGVILDPKQTEAIEDIYYKRHIAVGIPSMYGQYIEEKFEALGLMFRLERTASALMAELLQTINLEYITAKTLRRINDVLALFKEGLELDGIYNQGLNSNLDMFKYSLESPSFSLDQYINLFQFMAEDIQQITNEYFFDLYERPLKAIVPQIFTGNGPQTEVEKKQRYHMESERFLRDNLSSAFLVQDLDNFITNIINTLRSMIENYSDEFIKNLMTYDPDLTLSPLNRETVSMDNPVFLGAKAYFLKKIISYGFPVPPGFVLTTEVFRHKDTVTVHPHMNDELNGYILNYIGEIEKMTGTGFGNPENPLMFSVRSGSSLSLPGAMKTFLNVGMNDRIAEAFSKKEGCAWTAWDCYRRFFQSWGMAYGIERDVFDRIISEHKDRHGHALKVQFTPEQMRETCYDYKKVLIDHGIRIEEDPFLQLRQAILSVIDSWSSESAIYYRNHMQIADEWGTAVIVQKMVLGNLSTNSGTGVLFTNTPFNGYAGIDLYGDFALCSQGEDVVSGLVNTLPITEKQRKQYSSDSSVSLELLFPEVYEALLQLARQLIEQHGFVHQEIEFTFESEKAESLYLLQTRNQNLKKKKSLSTFVLPPSEMKLISSGIGIGAEALSGILAFTLEDMKEIREKKPSEKIILVRPDTVPDDIPLIFNCDGLITGKGGATSHAAVTAASLGKVCIVSCKGLRVDENETYCVIGGTSYHVGDRLSIDGNLGRVYEGKYEIRND